ncbi:histidine triad nucleotide-binding protein [Wohlfahrtiimonas populi]|uniref:histidine triad nucleotide-binding protein n=1 Tax=Wohlfahrtiimonas populi TaxID=1940240 RepID=UPI00098CFD4E|nr:histidine triad nucleotide-binding protein [Wohlfahrtiimonas populi]
MSTIFTKIINKEIPANIVYEDDEVLAFRDISPQAPEHILVIPKKEIPTVNDIEEADAALVGKLFLTAKKIAKELGFDEKGYRLVMNCNEDGGQTVNHIHMHILAGRQLSWPPG